MRLIHWLISLAAELVTRRRFHCLHAYSDMTYPRSCIHCGRAIADPADWNC